MMTEEFHQVFCSSCKSKMLHVLYLQDTKLFFRCDLCGLISHVQGVFLFANAQEKKQ